MGGTIANDLPSPFVFAAISIEGDDVRDVEVASSNLVAPT